MSTEQRTKPTAAGWKKQAVHDVVCPSGAEIRVKIPDLSELVINGIVPQNLLDVAIGAAEGDDDSKPLTIEQRIERVKQEQEFTKLLVLQTVVEPKLADADFDDIPFEDKEFIVALATRQREFDAVGDHIGGLTKSEKFRRFRGIREFEPDVEGL